jgi:DNA-binding transcriptional regulator YiaG
MNYETCPFCADSGFLASFTKGEAEKIKVEIPAYARQDKFWKRGKLKPNQKIQAPAELRGDRLRIVFDKKNFDDRWQDFKVEVFGIQSTGEMYLPKQFDRVYYSPPPPFFFASSISQGEDQPLVYRQFFACRITHKSDDVSIIVHWWANHGRKFDMCGSLAPESVSDKLEVTKNALSFFQRETRGSAKVTDVDIKEVIKLLGPEATQRKAAKALNVSESTLEKWRQRRGISTWRKVLEGYI